VNCVKADAFWQTTDWDPSSTMRMGSSWLLTMIEVTTEPLADDAEQLVGQAIDIGYRHIDTAWGYFNEEGVGAAVNNCGLPREDIFVTTKVWNSSQELLVFFFRAEALHPPPPPSPASWWSCCI
jgi:diketogulonate reductase-like aldo/keto reductase